MKKIVLLLIIFVLLFTISCDQSTDPESESKEIQSENSYFGEIKEVGQIDKYSFVAPANQHIHFVCKEQIVDSRFNPKLILKVNGVLLGENVHFKEAVVADIEVIAGKKYEIEISTTDQPGKYEIRLYIDTDDLKLLTENQEYAGTISYLDDVDDLIFRTNSRGSYHVELKELIDNSAFNPILSIYNGTNFLGTDVHFKQAVIVNNIFEQNIDYSLIADNAPNSYQGQYIILVKKDNDDSLYVFNSPFVHNGTMDYAGDNDRIYFQPPLTGNYTFTLTEAVDNSSYNPVLEINKNGLLASANHFHECKIENIYLSNANFYQIVIKDEANDDSGGYKLSIVKQ